MIQSRAVGVTTERYCGVAAASCGVIAIIAAATVLWPGHTVHFPASAGELLLPPVTFPYSILFARHTASAPGNIAVFSMVPTAEDVVASGTRQIASLRDPSYLSIGYRMQHCLALHPLLMGR